MSESKPCLRQTMDRVSEIRARCEAATPGPWWWSLSDLRAVIWGGAKGGNAATGKQIVVDGDEDFDCYPENAEFITNARDEIPYLLEQHAQLAAEIERLHGLLAERNVLLDKYEAENRWIPVGERLPDKVGRYLTTHISTTYKGNKPQKKVSELDWVGDECGWLINGLHQVTHWRPLPEPPKGV